MSSAGKPGILSNLPNPATRKQPANPVVVPPEAEEAFGLSPATAAARAPEPAPPHASSRELERSKTFFLPMSICERLEMQKLSERREMKHILRQALDEYFERNPLRTGVRELFKG
jgi:hypothetical protein